MVSWVPQSLSQLSVPKRDKRRHLQTVARDVSQDSQDEYTDRKLGWTKVMTSPYCEQQRSRWPNLVTLKEPSAHKRILQIQSRKGKTASLPTFSLGFTKHGHSYTYCHFQLSFVGSCTLNRQAFESSEQSIVLSIELEANKQLYFNSK